MCDLVKLVDFACGQSCFRQFTTLRYQANEIHEMTSRLKSISGAVKKKREPQRTPKENSNHVSRVIC